MKVGGPVVGNMRFVLGVTATLCVALSLLGCGTKALDEPSEDASVLESQTPKSTASSEAVPTWESSTPEPAPLGMRHYAIDELVPNQDWLSGPRTRLFTSDFDPKSKQINPFTVFASNLDGAWTPTLELPPGHTAQAQRFAVEQAEASLPRAAHAVVSLEAGTGLTASRHMVTLGIADVETQTVTMTQHSIPVPTDLKPDGWILNPGPHFEGMQMFEGTTVITLSWLEPDPDTRSKTFRYRVAYDATGTKLWERTDEEGNDDVREVLDDGDLIVGHGRVVFGLGEEYVALDILTGAEIYRKPGPYARGLEYQTSEVFVVEAYTDGGYGDGYSAFRIADGEPFGITSASGIVYDPIGDLYAAAYQADADAEGGWGCVNCPSFDPSKPALEVKDSSGSQVFALSIEDAVGLGQLSLGFAFDERLAVYIDDGVRIVSMRTGEPVPGFEVIAPGVTRSQGEPTAATRYIAIASTRQTLGYDELVVSDSPLSWDDFTVSLQG